AVAVVLVDVVLSIPVRYKDRTIRQGNDVGRVELLGFGVNAGRLRISHRPDSRSIGLDLEDLVEVGPCRVEVFAIALAPQVQSMNLRRPKTAAVFAVWPED